MHATRPQRSNWQDHHRHLAHHYAAHGRPVLPCKPDKSPYTEHGLHDATTDPAQIERWWDQWPDAIVGGRSLPGEVIIDVDAPKPDGSSDGFATLARLVAKHGPLPPCSVTRSAGGGRHYFFTDSRAQEIGNRTGGLPPDCGIHVRGGGRGYVILAGSVLPDGREYTILATAEVAPRLPNWLAVLLMPKPVPKEELAIPLRAHNGNASMALRRVGAILDWHCGKLASTKEGARNARLSASALSMGHLDHHGLGESHVRARLLAAAAQCGLPPHEAERSFASAYAKGCTEPRALPPSRYEEAAS